jgi:hypothetical protein
MTTPLEDLNSPPEPPLSDRWRRIRRLVGAITGLVLLVIAFLPALVNSDRVRRWMLDEANRTLAPGRIELGSLSATWFGPTTISGLVLREKGGQIVFKADSATWDKGLVQAIFHGYPRLGTLRFEQPEIAVERRADGTIDIHELLRPLIRDDPRVELKVVIDNGRLRFLSPELGEPLRAEHLDLRLEVAPEPTPIAWSARLANWAENHSIETLEVVGRFDQWSALQKLPLKLDLSVTSRNWPLSIALSKPPGMASGVLESGFSVTVQNDRLQFSGDASLRNLRIRDSSLSDVNLAPTEIVMHAQAETVSFEAPFHGGMVHLEPKLVLGTKRGPVVNLGPKSWIKKVEVNDELSREVLSFVAPVLAGATSVRGKVSAKVQAASIPLESKTIRQAEFEGTVELQDLTFSAGPGAKAYLAVAALDPKVTLRLDAPIQLKVADGRVQQKGLALPLGDVTRVEIEGWVDFDKNLDMTASLPITAAMLEDKPFLRTMLEGTKIRAPIRGTLDNPRVELDTTSLGLKEMGSRLFQNTVSHGMSGLFQTVIERNSSSPSSPPSGPGNSGSDHSKR